MRTKRWIILTLLSLCLHSVNAQIAPFKEGEQLKYAGSYYMSKLWTNLAEIKLEVLPVDKAPKPCYRLKGSASSYAAWDSYFKIRDVYQSWIEVATLKPIIFKRDVIEGTFVKDEKYIFKHKQNIAHQILIGKSKFKNERDLTIVPNTYDMISALYYVRTLAFDKMQIGKVTNISVLIDNKLEQIIVKYQGTEQIKTDNLGTFKCYKLAVNIGNTKIIKYKETNNIWITADNNRVPLLIKAEIPVGFIQIKITEMKGLKY